MKVVLIILIFFIANTCYSFDYSDNDKDIFYDAFIEGYIQEITNKINSLNIDENKKEKILKEFITQINRTELENSSWQCIKQYPVNEIVTASIVCTQNWNKKQSEKTKKIFEKFK